MCEYCGCQAITAIGDLTAEHDEIRDVCAVAAEAARAGDTARAVRAAGRLLELLGPHTAVEERGLFPAMATDFPDHVAALEAEHRAIEPVVAAVAAGRLEPGWERNLAEALRMLAGHIFKEQDGVFPAALATLGSEDWDAIDAVRAEVGTGRVRPPVSPV